MQADRPAHADPPAEKSEHSDQLLQLLLVVEQGRQVAPADNRVEIAVPIANSFHIVSLAQRAVQVQPYTRSPASDGNDCQVRMHDAASFLQAFQ